MWGTGDGDRDPQVLDIFEDELAALGREGAVGDKGGGKTGAGKGREDKTFNANRYTAGKVISRVQWHPSKKGIIAVSCVRPDSFEQRVLTAGTPDTYHVLLWSYRDTMGMPELVLEAPSEVFTFAFNPSNPDQIAGGCYNGQVIMWDISAHSAALEGRRKAQGPGEQKEETPHVPYCLISEVRGTEGGDAPQHGATSLSLLLVSLRHHSARLPPKRPHDSPGAYVDGTLSKHPRRASLPEPWALPSPQVELSHSKCVMDLQWLPGVEVARRGEVTGLGEDGAPGKDSVTVVTVSVDGNIMFWDTRADRYQQRIRAGREREVVDPRMSWVPMHSVKLMNDTGGDVACTSVCLKHGLSSELFVGSLSGLVLRASFTVPADSGLNPELVKAYLPGHCAAVTTLQLSPFFEDLLLTVGDWSFAIWKEGLPEPLFQSPMKGALARGGKQEDMVKLVCGCWSPTRPGVIFIGREDGHLDIWDLLDRSNEPSEVREIIMPRALTSLSFHPSVYTSRNQAGLASFLAIGDSEGTLHVHHLRSNLVRWGTQKEGKEREAMEGYWRREEARLSHRLARDAAREEREKEEADGDKEEGKKGKGRGNGEASGEELYDDAAQARYEELVEKYMVLCGLKQASGDE